MEKGKLLTNSLFVSLTAILCCALWGSATPFIKIGYSMLLTEKTVPSILLFAGIRFFFAGIFTILIFSVARKKFLVPKKSSIKYCVSLSLFQTIIQYLFFYIGLNNTSGVKGTVESGSSAFFSLLVASLVFKQEKLTFKKIFACVLGFLGLIVLNFNELDFNMNFFGDAFVIFSAISLAFSSALVKLYSKDEDPVVLSGYQFVLGGFILSVIGYFLGGTIVIDSLKSLSVLGYLALLSAVAYSLWGLLLKHNPVSKITIFSFSTPVLGVILSSLLLTEDSNTSIISLIATLILICLGIVLLNYKKQ